MRALGLDVVPALRPGEHTGEVLVGLLGYPQARVDALIAPLPLPDAQPFAPFLFGDHLWEATTKFAEQRGIAHLRAPRGISGSTGS